MKRNDESPVVRHKHLLTDEELAAHSGVSAEDLNTVYRGGNGLRVHRTYIVIISLVALVLLGVAIAIAGTTM